MTDISRELVKRILSEFGKGCSNSEKSPAECDHCLGAAVDAVMATIARAEADKAAAAGMAAALEKSRGAWDNVLELGLIPERHRSTAEELRDGAAIALAVYCSQCGKT